jgi:hypothetical protein
VLRGAAETAGVLLGVSCFLAGSARLQQAAAWRCRTVVGGARRLFFFAFRYDRRDARSPI